MGKMIISSLNALIEALKQGQSVSRVWISQEKRGGKINVIKDLCRKNGVVYQFVPKAVLDRKAGGPHQGVCGQVAPVRFFALEDVLQSSTSGLLLMLDGVEDTGNLGAIIRTAAAVGVDGIVLSQRRSAPVNETVWKTSAGALGKVRIVIAANMAAAVAQVKFAGFWVVGTLPRASMTCFDLDFRPPFALILGGEHAGISPLLQKRADALVAIPHSPQVESLNVSVAAAVILFEALRQRRGVEKLKC